MARHGIPPAEAGERVTVLGREGCHLCDDALVVVAQVCAETGVGWREVSIDEHPQARAAWAEDIPVVLVDDEVHARWRVDPARLRVALIQHG